MAFYIPVPRDLSRVKTKILFGLNKRQLICFGIGAAIGIPAYFLIKRSGNVSLAAMSMIIIMMPMFFLALYEKNGQPLEVILHNMIQFAFVKPKVRPYQTENDYTVLERTARAEKEAETIVRKAHRREKGKKKASRS